MEQLNLKTAVQPMIVKYVEASRNGVQSHTLSRNAIGFIMRGTKYIYEGDKRIAVPKGSVFFLCAGSHYMENVSDEDGRPFEQIVFYYTPAELHKIITNLNVAYDLAITNSHSCESCRSQRHVAMEAWGALRNLFANANTCLRDDQFMSDRPAENIKMTELVYMIASHGDCCLKSKLLRSIDTTKENFEQIVYSHLFTVVNIDDLAHKCNRSLTSFKKEFRKVFGMPPHQWFIRQRLIHSRLLLISTSKSISEIGNECTFPNTSHFIKLFKKEYKLTPAAYRSMSRKEIQYTPEPTLPPTTAPLDAVAV